MKKINDISMLIIGILLFFISYSVDRQVNLFFRGAEFPLFDVILGTITNFGVVILVMLIIPSVILLKKNKKTVYLLLLTFAASIALSFIIKLIVLRQRPIEAFTYPFISIINYSFPSMHAMVVFSLLPVLNRNLPTRKKFWIVFAFLAAFSRVYFKFHFLSDVVFGALAGYFIGNYLLKLHEKKDYENKQS